MDLIFISSDESIECEEVFIAYHKAFPEIKRIHGKFNKERLEALCAGICDDKNFAVINGDNLTIPNSDEINAIKDFLSGAHDKSNIVSWVGNVDDYPLLKDIPDGIENYDGHKDIIYLSYDELIADSNFISIKKKYPQVKRLHKVKDMTRAYATVAYLSSTKWYVLVDGDNEVLPDADLNNLPLPNDIRPLSDDDLSKAVLIYGTTNNVNDTKSCYGGIKVCPTLWFRGICDDKVDPIASRGTVTVFNPKKILSVTNFNSDEFSSWKAGFRIAVMIATVLITDFKSSGHWSEWLAESMTAWKTKGADKPFGTYCIDGATDGEKFASEQIELVSSSLSESDKTEALTKRLQIINNPGWLRQRFEERYKFDK